MADVPQQNLNSSPSPGGDGVTSSTAERTAHGLDRADNQPGQQRVNAALRRERGDNPGDKVGTRPSLIQSPGEVLPGDASDAAINAAETARRDAADAERKLEHGELPQGTIDEMNAGKQALQRNRPRNEALDANTSDRQLGAAPVPPTNPVDDLAARQRAGQTTPPQPRSSSGT